MNNRCQVPVCTEPKLRHTSALTRVLLGVPGDDRAQRRGDAGHAWIESFPADE
jgi:hypothetical protein